MMLPDFIPGLQLSKYFYKETVSPILKRHFPDLIYSAALIGYSSEVLGYDTPVSRDHMWGPRLQLFLPDENFDTNRSKVNEVLRNELPDEI